MPVKSTDSIFSCGPWITEKFEISSFFVLLKMYFDWCRGRNLRRVPNTFAVTSGNNSALKDLLGWGDLSTETVDLVVTATITITPRSANSAGTVSLNFYRK